MTALPRGFLAFLGLSAAPLDLACPGFLVDDFFAIVSLGFSLAEDGFSVAAEVDLVEAGGRANTSSSYFLCGTGRPPE